MNKSPPGNLLSYPCRVRVGEKRRSTAALQDASGQCTTAITATFWSAALLCRFSMMQRGPLPFCVSFQLLRQIGRHVGENDRVVTVVAQFQHVTDPVNLGDQRALVCGDAEPGAQSP